MIRIFISSVQKEFVRERMAIRDFLNGDPLLRRFYEVFLFEDIPAKDRSPDGIYLDEVGHCNIYLGIFGDQYGTTGQDSLSPTHREFREATKQEKYRIIFVKGADDSKRNASMQALIKEASNVLNRKRFATKSELIAGIYASLVEYLSEQELIRVGPFDASYCRNATLDDIDDEKLRLFLKRARKARGFPLPEDAEPLEVLTHLNLL
ncbi:MAG: DUF4062 domain-containing protein, partial [Candidatus Margulisiibacteriota bacterium]